VDRLGSDRALQPQLHPLPRLFLDDVHDSDFSLAEAKQLIDDIAEISKPVLVLSGGEPLLRKDLFEIASYGRRRDSGCASPRTGARHGRGRGKDEGVGDPDLLPVAGRLHAAVHDDFRKQPGAFEATLRAAEIFTRNGMQFIVNSSFTKRNQHDIAATCKLAKSIGAHACTCS